MSERSHCLFWRVRALKWQLAEHGLDSNNCNRIADGAFKQAPHLQLDVHLFNGYDNVLGTVLGLLERESKGNTRSPNSQSIRGLALAPMHGNAVQWAVCSGLDRPCKVGSNPYGPSGREC